MNQISQALLATLFPISCQICGKLVEENANGVTCQHCWDQLIPSNSDPASIRCLRCGYPSLPPAGAPYLDCLYCRPLPSFHSARTCGPYEGALRANILALKFQPHLCQKLVDLLKMTYQQEPLLQASTRILPIPLHAERLRERGFNQAEVI